MLTLTRQGLLLSLSATVIPSQGSSDVPVAVVNDINTYVGYTLEPRVGYYLNGIYKSTVCTYDTSAKTFSVPAEAFKQIGIIDITLALIDNANANHIETCQAVHATVNKAPLGTVILPDQTTWQEYVRSYTQGFLNDYTTTTIDPLVTQAQQAIATANQASQNVQTAYNNLGNYKVENGILYFMKADGTYNQQGILLAGQSTILDGQNNPILNGSMTPQDNLLINSDFRSGIINQKGQTEYTNTSYTSQMTVDGWFIHYGKVNVYANSVYFDNTGSTEYGYKHPLSLPSDTYTFYLDCAINGSARVFARNLENEEVIDETVSGTVKKSFTFTNSLKFITIIASAGTKISFNFMKLEKGSYFTGMPVWNLSVEILKCQRYLFSCHKISGYGFETGGGNVYIYVNIPTPMQKQGTVSVNSTVQVIGDGAYKTLTISSVNVSSQDNNLVILSGVLSEVGNLNIVKIFEFNNFTLDAYNY